MEASNATPSFLCFLPEHPCTSPKVLYVNGITESSGMQHFPTTKRKKNGVNGSLNSPNRVKSAPAEAVSGAGNGCVENSLSSAAGGECQREALNVGSSVATALEDPRDETEKPHVIKRTLSLSFNQVESRNVPIAECNGHCNLSKGLVEEEDDELAFEITEFFRAFRDGKEHTLRKWRERLSSASPDSSLDSRITQLGHISNLESTDDRSGFGKPGMLWHDSTDTAMTLWSSSASQSGTWNGLTPYTDSHLATLSGPLALSGQISFSGPSGLSPYSGSVSHRSDSSTASTHSFAFPILPFEWNSSPVKMPQPDQRPSKKGWQQRLRTLFCCQSFS